MRVMKNSGIDWINIVPNSWHTTRLKSVLVERNEKNNPIKTTNLLSLSIERGVFPYSEKTGGGNKAKENFEDYKLAYVNDIVLNSMNVVVGAVGISKYYGCVSPVYYTLYSRNNELYNINYYNYIFQSEVFQKNLWGLGNGIVVKESDNGKLNTIRMRIPMEKLNGIILPVPSIEEQEKIACFLDEKIKEIDNAIEKTKETIEDYKKLKHSTITSSVTHGLCNDVKMKKSRIEWLESIPEHWQETVLKNKIYVRARLGWKGLKAEEYVEEGYPLLSAFNIINSKLSFDEVNYINKFRYDESPEIKLRIGDILLVKDGAGIGKCAIVENLSIESTVNGSIALLTCDDTLCSKYLYYYFLSSIFQQYIDRLKDGMGVPHLFQRDIKTIYLAIPPIKEQKQIVEFLNYKCNEIDKLIVTKEKIVEELEQYKKSVIYEYVTGKKEVK